MKTVELTADVYSNTEGIAYRLYVDETLMTERTFRWEPRKKCVEEHAIVQIEQGVPHTIRIESVKAGEYFTLKNITVDGIVSSSETFIV